MEDFEWLFVWWHLFLLCADELGETHTYSINGFYEASKSNFNSHFSYIIQLNVKNIMI